MKSTKWLNLREPVKIEKRKRGRKRRQGSMRLPELGQDPGLHLVEPGGVSPFLKFVEPGTAN
jgi:hypothetical protein